MQLFKYFVANILVRGGSVGIFCDRYRRSALTFKALHLLRSYLARRSRRTRPDQSWQGLFKRFFCLGERGAVLGTARTSDARLNRAQIELHHLRILGVTALRGVEQSLLLAISFHQRNLLRPATGGAQIIQCGLI